MEEHRTRVASATNAATLGDLQSLVDDLQTENAPVQMPDLKKPSAARPAAPQAAAGASAPRWRRCWSCSASPIGWGLYGNTPSPLNFTSDPGAKADGIPAKVLTPPRQLQSLGGLDRTVRADAAASSATPRAIGLTIYPDYAIAGARRTPPTTGAR